jgi:hypothetical protein
MCSVCVWRHQVCASVQGCCLRGLLVHLGLVGFQGTHESGEQTVILVVHCARRLLDLQGSIVRLDDALDLGNHAGQEGEACA